jgi:protein-S-isoprenylcysteine O-methyltransferase
MVAQVSWRNPGCVSSAVRNPPPGTSPASSTRTERPARASVAAATRPLGPDPTTTASRVSIEPRLAGIRVRCLRHHVVVDVLRGLINSVTLLWLAFETWRTVREASRHGRVADRGSRFLVVVCIFIAGALTIHYGDRNVWSLGHLRIFEICGLVSMVCGLALRVWAVLTLGKFFTGTVMIQADHEVVDNGPYHWLRHPSYTAMGVGFMGYALTTASVAALIAMAMGIVVGLGYRIYVEEQALIAGLGESYREYAARTKRVIPYVF